MVQRDGVGVAAGLARTLELAHVDRHGSRLEADLFLTAGGDDAVAQLASQEAERLPQRSASVRLVAFGRQERDDRVAAAEPLRAGEREVHEERAPLRLAENCPN